MAVTIIVGGQWGDEGKGKVVDLLAQEARYVVRCQGGNNAGHTVINEFGEFKLNLIPSGIFVPSATAVIGNGVALNPGAVLAEIEMLQARGIDVSRLRISDRATVVMPYHILLDQLEEEARGDAQLGTTLKGIGPAYEDKVGRYSVRVGDLLDIETLESVLRTTLARHNATFTGIYGAPIVELDAVVAEYLANGERLAPYIADTVALLHGALERGEPILLEGAQGTLLDLEYGTYPYVTSSYPCAAGACLGAGIPPTAVSRVIGIYKAYTSRVGAGPFPTEQSNEIGEQLRRIGNEYGTVTGRPRRCGWFDAVASRYTARVNGCTSLAITRLDVLDSFPSLRICGRYRLDGEEIDCFPAGLAAAYACEPVWQELEGWQRPTRTARRLDDLPKQARAYIARIEELVGVPAGIIGVGPERNETIIVG